MIKSSVELDRRYAWGSLVPVDILVKGDPTRPGDPLSRTVYYCSLDAALGQIDLSLDLWCEVDATYDEARQELVLLVRTPR